MVRTSAWWSVDLGAISLISYRDGIKQVEKTPPGVGPMNCLGTFFKTQ